MAAGGSDARLSRRAHGSAVGICDVGRAINVVGLTDAAIIKSIS